MYSNNNNAVNGTNVVAGIFRNTLSVENAVQRLRSRGFLRSHVSVLLPESTLRQDFSSHYNTIRTTHAAATTGAAAGVLLGGILGWLAALGSVAAPGIGFLIVAGPLMGMLAGVGVGGTLGGITGALIGFGFGEFEANSISQRVMEGEIFLSVHCPDMEFEDAAKKILRECGAVDIISTATLKQDLKSSVPNDHGVAAGG